MASSINTTNTNKDGLAVNSPLIVSGGSNTSFAVLAHQIDWRETTFADIDISTQEGVTYTERLLNTIENYIKSEGINNLITTSEYIVDDNKDLSNVDTATNGIKVITGVNLSSTGTLSYTYSYIYNPHDDHGSTGVAKTKVTFGQTDASSTKVITNIKMDTNGSLSYTYIDLEYDKDHHGSTGTTGTKVTFGQTDASSTKVITNIKMDTNGSLSYTYIDLEYDKDHHGSTGSLNNKTTSKIIGNIYVNSNGSTSYTYMDLWGHL